MRALSSRGLILPALLTVLVALTSGIGCERDAPATGATGLYFVDAATPGLEFRHDRGASGERHLFETMGGGVAWIDFDVDGDLDVFVPQGTASRSRGPTSSSAPAGHRLLRNDGGTFSDVTTASGLDAPGYGLGAAVGDVDNDGDPDLYLLRFGPNALFLNDGGGRFRESTDAGVAGLEPFSGSAGFGDLDGDGSIDLFLTGYVELDPRSTPRCTEPRADGQERLPIYCGPHNFKGASDRVFLNNGDGTFRDATERAGLRAAGQSSSKSLGVLIADLDEDHDLDVFVACDTTANLLYRNHGDGRFAEVGLAAGVAASDTGAYEGGMGVVAGDIDRDGRLDLFVTNYSGESNRLYCGMEGGRFRDATSRFRAAVGSHLYVGWGAALEDLDLDGDQDLFVGNGHIFDNVDLWDDRQRYRQRCFLLRFDAASAGDSSGSGSFVEVGRDNGAPVSTARPHRGVAAGDADNDGDVDLLLAALDEPLTLLENRGSRGGRGFLVVELVGSGPGGRDAIGARVDIETANGTLTRWRVGGGSYLSAGDHRLHFGLGTARSIERLRVTWPGGAREELDAPPRPGTFVRIEKGKGIVRAGSGEPPETVTRPDRE